MNTRIGYKTFEKEMFSKHPNAFIQPIWVGKIKVAAVCVAQHNLKVVGVWKKS